MVGGGGGFLGAFVDAGQVAEEADGPAGVLVVVVVVAVSFQHVQELEDEVQVHPVIGGHGPSSSLVVPDGRMPGAVPVPAAGFQPWRGR